MNEYDFMDNLISGLMGFSIGVSVYQEKLSESRMTIGRQGLFLLLRACIIVLVIWQGVTAEKIQGGWGFFFAVVGIGVGAIALAYCIRAILKRILAL